MDILDILLDILLKPPQPLMGLFLILYTHIGILTLYSSIVFCIKQREKYDNSDMYLLSFIKFCGVDYLCPCHERDKFYFLRRKY